MPDPTRRVALVTGAARGVGLGIARALAEAGHDVYLADLDTDAAEREASRLRDEGHFASSLLLDVARADSWAEAMASVDVRSHRLDVLVNNAGISPRSTPESTDEALWDRTLGINLKGPWLGIKAAMPLLKATGGGSIVNVGSTHSTVPHRNLFVYGVSKAGLLAMTRGVAIEYLDQKITCNMLAPGWVASPGEIAIQAGEGRPDFPEGMRHVSTPEEAGAAVVYLASDAARRVTGAALYLDGGLHAFGDARLVHTDPPHRPDHS